LRAVLDTNVVISALVFGRSSLSWMRSEWRRGSFTPLADRETVAELLRALGYPKFGLDRADIEALLEDYLPHCEVIAPSRSPSPPLPRPSDPDDVKFLALAYRGQADTLVTGDKGLLALSGRTRFRIETPATFKGRLGRS
jgi:putative PIN family toxin of toxin-antitoxin system